MVVVSKKDATTVGARRLPIAAPAARASSTGPSPGAGSRNATFTTSASPFAAAPTAAGSPRSQSCEPGRQPSPARNRLNRALTKTLAVVRAVDAIARVRRDDFLVPPVPFGPTSPFQRVRALLGPEYAHLTDPTVVQALAKLNHGIASQSRRSSLAGGGSLFGGASQMRSPPAAATSNHNNTRGGKHSGATGGAAGVSGASKPLAPVRAAAPAARHELLDAHGELDIGCDATKDTASSDDEDDNAPLDWGTTAPNSPAGMSPAASSALGITATDPLHPQGRGRCRGRKKASTLPRGKDVASMPRELADGIRAVAIARLSTLLYPRLLLRRSRRVQAAQTAASLRHAARVTPDLLKRNPLFADWPIDVLNKFIGSMRYSCTDARRIVLYRGEPAGGPLAVLVSGYYELIGPPEKDDPTASLATVASAPHVGGVTTPPTSAEGGSRLRTDNSHASFARVKSQVIVPVKKRMVVLRRVTAPNVLNEFSYLTWEPRMSTVKAGPRAELWTCDRSAFERAVESLPAEIRAAVTERARAKRLRDVARLFPLTPQMLAQHGALSACSDTFRRALCAVMRPLGVPAGHYFTASDQHDLPPGEPFPSQLVLVLRGEVGTLRVLHPASAGSGGYSSTRRHTMIPAASLGGTMSTVSHPPLPPAELNFNAASTSFLIGRNSSIQSPQAPPQTAFGASGRRGSASGGDPLATSRRSGYDAVVVSRKQAPILLNEAFSLLRAPSGQANEVVQALAPCDGYAADADEVDRLLAAHPQDRAAITSHSQRRQQTLASAEMARHRVLLPTVPFIGKRLGPEALRALSTLFEARVFPPLSVVCSASQAADHVMILAKGTVCIGQGRSRRRWQPKEAIGYTCVVKHRWAHTAVAVDTAEVIVLPRHLFVAFLKDCGLYHDACTAAKALIFPNAPCPDPLIKAVAVQEEASRDTPPMYPIFEDAEEVKSTLEGLVPSALAAAPTPVMGGLSASVLPTASRLSHAERMAIEAEVSSSYRPEQAHRHLTKVTGFLYVKNKPL
jgi:CRP-like cAMP-binding protein